MQAVWPLRRPSGRGDQHLVDAQPVQIQHLEPVAGDGEMVAQLRQAAPEDNQE